MTGVLINPGTGSVGPGALLRHAWRAVRQLRRDVLDPSLVARADLGPAITDRVQLERRPRADDHRHESGSIFDSRGRYGFAIRVPGSRWIPVDVPGLPVERIRYLGLGQQSAWDYPRLYVDGNSWLWEFAVSVLRGCLSGAD